MTPLRSEFQCFDEPMMEETSVHFDHGSGFQCVYCFLEKLGKEDIDAARRVIAQEEAMSTQRGGLLLKLLMDKRQLEEPEALMLLCASSFAACAGVKRSEFVYVLYHILCSKWLDMDSCKRFKTSNSYKSLRRRVRILKSVYGDDEKGGPQHLARTISKYPVDKLRERAAVILGIVKLLFEEKETVISGRIFENTAQKGGYPDGTSNAGETGNPRYVVASEGERGTGSEISRKRRNSRVAGKPTGSNTQHSIQHSECELGLSEVSGFYDHFVCQYDSLKADVEKVYEKALLQWIPNAALVPERERKLLLNSLKSLFFIALKNQRYFEAQRILTCVLQWTETSTQDYWRFMVYQLFLNRELHRLSKTSDLYNRFMLHLHEIDKQIFLSLKVEELAEHSRWKRAEITSQHLVVPRIEASVGAWIKVLKTKLMLSFVYDRVPTLLKLLNDELNRLEGQTVRDTTPDNLASASIKLMTTISQRFPIHLFLLSDIVQALWSIILTFEGKAKAEYFSRVLRPYGLSTHSSHVKGTVHQLARHCFNAGNGQAASMLYRELTHEWKVTDWEILLHVGKLSIMRKEWDRAIEVLTRALNVAEEHFGCGNSYATVLCFYSAAAQMQKRYALAEKTCIAAAKIYESLRNANGLALARYVKACLLIRLNAFEATIHELKKVLECFVLIRGKDKHFEVTATLTALSASYFLLGNNEQANLFHRRCCASVREEKFGEDHPDRNLFLSCRKYGQWVDFMVSQGSVQWSDLLIYHVFPKSVSQEFAFGDELYIKVRHLG